MADTYTQALKARRIEEDAYPDDWADRLNSDVVDIFDAGISGQVEVDIGSATTYALEAMQNGTLSDSHYFRLNFVGTPASAVTVTIPASVTPSKHYLVDNQTGQALTVKYAATAGVTIQDGDAVHVYCDGTSVIADTRRPRYDITAAENAAGVVPVYGQFMPFPLYDVHRLGVVGDGDGAGGGTDDSAAIQNAFSMIMAVGGTLIFDATRIYRCDAGLSLLSTTITPRAFRVMYNNCRLDFSNLTGSAKALRYGATSLANAHAAAAVHIGSVRMLGPEANGYPMAYAEFDTTTTGVSLEYCLHWTIEQHEVLAFFTGWRTFWSWSILNLNHHIRNCYQDLHVDELSTFATWIGCNFLQSAVGILLRGADTIACQNFISCRLETNDVHVHADADPGSAGGDDSIRAITFRDCYLEDAEYDWFRIGMDYDATAASSVRQATNSSGEVTDFLIDAGNWSNNTLAPASGQAAICFDKDGLVNTRVRGFRLNGPISLRQRCQGRPSKSSWRTTRNQQHETDELESFEIGEGYCNFTMTSSSATIGRVGGNIQSITHVSNGVVDINFYDEYSGINEYCVMGTCDNGIVTKDTVNSTTGKVRLVIRDFAGTAAFSNNVSIVVKGRQE